MPAVPASVHIVAAVSGMLYATPVTRRPPGGPGGQGRTRWDVVSEAVRAGWAATLRLAVLMVVPGGGVGAGAALVVRLLDEFARRI